MPTSPTSLMHRLWQDERGVVNSAEMVFVLSILVIGAIVGLAALRDAIVTELGDTGMAVGAVDQSYDFDEIAITNLQFGNTNQVTVNATVAGSEFEDTPDFCEQNANACIVIAAGGTLNEGDGAPVVPGVGP